MPFQNSASNLAGFQVHAITPPGLDENTWRLLLPKTSGTDSSSFKADTLIIMH